MGSNLTIALESIANVHTAADLHAHPDPQSALVSRAVGAANVLTDTSSFISRNENDSAAWLTTATRRFTKTPRRYYAEPQDFESVRRFELESGCDILNAR